MAKYRKYIQWFSLLVFGLLILVGKVQAWMLIFVGGLFLSTIRGRYYCGYICPINTVMEVIDDQTDKKKIKRLTTPNWIKGNFFRGIILILFLGTMIFVVKTGKKLPVLPILFLLGILLTLIFESSLWHRYLCPYGTLFSIVSRKNRVGYTIEKEDCIKCGICVKVCPTDAISWKDKTVHPFINKNECIVCGKCEAKCPKGVITK